MANTAGRTLLLSSALPSEAHRRRYSELAEPHKLLSYLLQQRIMSLSSDIIAVYLHAAMKVFGSWAAELADRWDDDDLPKVRGVVDDVLERLASFVTHADIEVQERVSLMPRCYPAVTHLRPPSSVWLRYVLHRLHGF